MLTAKPNAREFANELFLIIREADTFGIERPIAVRKRIVAAAAFLLGIDEAVVENDGDVAWFGVDVLDVLACAAGVLAGVPCDVLRRCDLP